MLLRTERGSFRKAHGLGVRFVAQLGCVLLNRRKIP
jgi:hypothetical protein